MEEAINATNVTVEAVNENTDSLNKTAESIKESIKEAMDSFSDEVPPTEEQKIQAKGFLNNFLNYIKGSKFKEDVKIRAKMWNKSEKEVAKGFFNKILGTIGDVFGIAIGTVGDVCHLVIDIVSTVLHGAVNGLCQLADAITRCFTLNKTCVA